MENIFFDIGFVIIIATMFAYFAKFLKQPLIPAYILAGVIIGPVLGLITNTEVITTLSEIGIAFLLFIVGLEINIKKLKDVGIVSSFGGIIQVIAISAIAFIISLLLGFIILESVYIALVIALSSTMVVIKLLSDKREIDTLHGKIIIGILLIQDIVAIIALSILGSLNEFSFIVITISIIKGILAILVAVAVSKYIFPSLFGFAAKSQELLFISAVAVSFLYSILFNYLGFSIAIGAFIAGVSLANLQYNIEIIAKVKSLRDFFSVMFFVSLGMELLLGTFNIIIKPLIVLLLLVIIAKPLIIIFTTSFFGHKKRTSFLTAVSLAQISEFSLIIVTQGLLLGHINQEIFSLTVLLAIITITLTTYFIKFENRIYKKLARYLDVFDKFTENKDDLEYMPKRKKKEIILCGYNRIGYGIVKTLRKIKKSVLVVDFNPETIRNLIRQKLPCLYGDIGDIEVLERLNFKKAKMVISTIPTKTDNKLLIRTAKKENNKIIIFVTGRHIEDALELYDAGADYVVLPHFLGGEHLSLLVENFTGDVNKIIEYKLKHINELKERHALGHEHPAHRM
ncbi:sodium:proton exchanger [Candidatus Woesearchaeota archaeon]|nr:sodium:proton exchanger [Candidatus Woesearchaeota archaeon]|tara:strand:+ start:1244 stop:2950 length:1707 start_codon:yes stop_codon:yes gene_type:complete